MVLPAILPLPLGGAPATSALRDAFDVVLGGVGYMVDYTTERYSDHSVAKLKPQSDQGAQVGAASLNPEGLWPVTISEWHLGAGQLFLDKPDSDSRRFRSSKYVNIWDEGELKLLKRGSVGVASTLDHYFLSATAGDRLYISGLIGRERLHWTDDDLESGASYAAVTGIPTSDVKSLASDGFHVMAAYSGDGLYLTNASINTISSWITGMVDVVGYVKNRVMVAEGRSIYNVTTSYDDTAALPTALFTHGNIDFKWVDFAEGQSHIYAAGYSGDKSEIYRIDVQDDATGLDAPVIAGRLTDGEVVQAIYGYGEFLLIGTDEGFRLALQSTTGDLRIGALVVTGSPVRAFAGWRRFVYFTWENVDDVTSGIGRLDLQNLTDSEGLVPAYAVDLQYSRNNVIIPDVAIYRGIVTYTHMGVGLIFEGSDLYPITTNVGVVESGAITFNVAETKVAVSVRVEATIDPNSGDTVDVYLKPDDGSYVKIGTVTTGGSTILHTQIEGSRLELKLELVNGATLQAVTPVVHLVQVFAHPRIRGVSKGVLPLVLRSSVDKRNGAPAHYDINTELDRLIGWWDGQDLLTLDEGTRTRTVVIEDYQMAPEDDSVDHTSRHGLFYAEYKVIDDRMDQ
ncbi:MAG: hypothetical protein GY773_18025 [Actinomycetia bacterium]|nr:hypothetical protein [Actinomycetes bacterium]